ncbi:MAG: hypothetical protein HOQ45_17680 [Nocardioidaceae bacterium]|nr:hypothetical protein [Nocardioidaceae bacterium]
MTRTRFVAAGAVLAVGLVALLPALLLPEDGRVPRDSSPPPRVTTSAPVSPTPPSGRPLARLAIAGDTGTRDGREQATADEMADQGDGRRYDALLLLGDLVYETGDAELTEESVTRPFDEVLGEGAVLVPVLGNHDVESDEQSDILRRLGRDRAWYQQRVGPVRILALDSNRPDDPAQTAWLRARLAERQPPGTWTIAVMHHPAYSAGEHGSSLDVRRAWSPLFARAGVSLVLAGHDHDYQRSTPQQGVTYVVSGGGAKLRPTGREGFTAFSRSVRHYVDLQVYRDRLVGRAIDQQGHTFDTWTLRR